MGAELCRAGTLHSWEATEPAYEQPTSGWAHISAGSSSSMKSKEAAGGTSTALLTQLCAAPAAAWLLGVFTRNHHGLTQPLQTPSIHHLCSTISIRTSLPLHTVLALHSACKKSFIRLTTATKELFVTTQSKLDVGLLKLRNVRDMLRVPCAKCSSTAWTDQDTEFYVLTLH